MTSRTGQWRALLLVTRVIGAAGAVTLLGLHHVTDFDRLLAVVTIGYTAVSCGLVMRFVRVAGSPWFWMLDTGGALALIYLSGDWRSPFYIVGLSSLVLPATSLGYRRAIGWGIGYTALYFGVGVATERLASGDLHSAIRLETLATHIMLPLIFTVLLAYAAMLLDRLRDEQERSERLAVQSERQRIAWELHDSAKQRMHAAQLLLSAASGRGADESVQQALGEVRAAAADMETSVAELRTPLEDRELDVALRERAAELAAATSARISVEGRIPPLAPVVLSHVHRIAVEALANAVRHAAAERIDVRLARAGGRASVDVVDDGAGMPPRPRPGATGLRIMRDRAATIGARLDVGPGPGGRGTRVSLTIPTTQIPREQP